MARRARSIGRKFEDRDKDYKKHAKNKAVGRKRDIDKEISNRTSRSGRTGK